MKFAIINAFCGFGSTGINAVKNYERLKKLGHDAHIYYGRRKSKETNEDYVYFGNKLLSMIDRILGDVFGLSGSISFIQTWKLLRELSKYNPDIIWLSNIHSAYINEPMLFKYLKKAKSFIVYGMVDEYAFLGKCCNSYDCDKYKYESGCRSCPHQRDYPKSLLFDNSKMKFRQKQKEYDGLNNIIFRSAPYVVSKAKESWLLKKARFEENDSSVDSNRVFYPRNSELIRKELGISEDKKVVLLCAPFSSTLKGGHYFLEAASLCENEDIVFINIAYDGPNNNLPNNFIGLPYLTDRDKMAEYYSLADAYVCTSVVDAQPNACLEAICCGTPIIGFNTSGVPYIADEKFGIFVKPFEVSELVQAIKAQPRKNAKMVAECREYGVRRYSLETSEKVYNEFILKLTTEYYKKDA